MSEELKKAYEQYAPRWFKVIRWREWAMRQYNKQYYMLAVLYAPVFIFTYLYDTNPYPFMLCWYQPKTQEERDQLKKKWIVSMNNAYVGRNWEMGQYHGEVPPVYDVWERRKKYPEYYGNKYDTFARDAFCDTAPNGFP